MMGLVIDRDKCVLCGTCVGACPNGALEVGAELIFNENNCILCGACADNCPVGAITLNKEEEAVSEVKSGVWVAVQQSDGAPLPVAFELLGKGRELADALQVPLCAVVIGRYSGIGNERPPVQADRTTRDFGTMLFHANQGKTRGFAVTAAPETKGSDPLFRFADDLIKAGADEVLCCTADWIGDTDDAAYAELMIPLIRERQPEIVLFGATILGRSAAPKIASALKTGLTADCTALSIEPDSRLLAQTRPALGGNLMATIVCPSSRPQMATVRPGIFARPVPDESRTGKIEKITPPARTDGHILILEEAKKAHEAGIADEEILIVAGRGIGSRKNLKLVFELANLMGAGVGVSRPLIDMGWAEYPHQVGQTGASVSPKLLISLGVSGAIQHLAGIGGAKTVVAVNTDESAPIMKRADYVVNQDCVGFVREMIRQLGKE